MGQSILIVDDSASLRALLRMALEEAGYGVREAGDGIEALELLRRERVDLVVSDLNMPRLDGLGLLKALRQTAEAPPVLVLTACSERPELQEACMTQGAQGWVLKLFPFDAKDLLVRVAEILATTNSAGRSA